MPPYVMTEKQLENSHESSMSANTTLEEDSVPMDLDTQYIEDESVELNDQSRSMGRSRLSVARSADPTQLSADVRRRTSLRLSELFDRSDDIDPDETRRLECVLIIVHGDHGF